MDSDQFDWIIDRGYLPYSLVRIVTRQILRSRCAELNKISLEEATAQKQDFVTNLRTQPIAIERDSANTQQYQVSTGLFAAFLGPRMKYSCSQFTTGKETLAEAETATLRDYAKKAEIKDGMSILDLGCGWGAGVLYLAEQYPASSVTGLSNSVTQKQHILAEAAKRKLGNVDIITGDVTNYEFRAGQFDRVISIELFEHMKNYDLLMAKIATWLKPHGKLFVQILCQRDHPYDFDTGWMARYFFTGGTMLSADLLLYFQRDLKIQQQWWVSGLHYSKTLEAWLSALVSNRKQAWPHLVETYGEKEAATWYNRWTIYLLTGSEFFGQQGGNFAGISHYLFEKT